MLSWSSGLGRHPLTVEIAGSTPAGSGLNTRSIIFGFILDCCVWIKISDFKKNPMYQIPVEMVRIQADDILTRLKIKDVEIMEGFMILKTQKQRLYT